MSEDIKSTSLYWLAMADSNLVLTPPQEADRNLIRNTGPYQQVASIQPKYARS